MIPDYIEPRAVYRELEGREILLKLKQEKIKFRSLSIPKTDERTDFFIEPSQKAIS